MLPEYLFDIKIGQILKQWRKKARITQEEMADKICTTRQSINRIENGLTHCKCYTIYVWSLITKNPISSILPYFNNAPDDCLLHEIISGTSKFSEDMKKAVHCIIYEKHGGNVQAVLHLFVMYLRCPLRDRQNLTLLILNCYKTALERGEIEHHDFIPDMQLVADSQELGRQAFIKNKNQYVKE